MTIPALRGKVVVVTGVDGFVGRHVARLAAGEGARVIGVSRSAEVDGALGAHLESYHRADLRHEWPIDVSADAVVHLAGRAAVGPSFRDPQGYIEDNSAMVTTMCEALLATGTTTRIVGVSTGAVYAQPRDAIHVIDEADPVFPSSPYAVSKLLVEHQLDYYGARGLSTVVARPFNHLGPGQGPGFLLPDLVARLRSLPEDEPLIVGDLDTERDYSDVRDIASGYLTLAAAPALRQRVYNLATGVSTSGRALLSLAADALGRDVPPVRVDESLVRPADPRCITGSAQRLRDELGWRPAYSLAESVADAIAAA